MSYVEDNTRKGLKVYREHTLGVPLENKAIQTGCEIDDQTDDGQYVLSKAGDEVGWGWWDKATRVQGAWGQIFPCLVGAANTVRPVLNQGLGADSSFETKELVLVAAADDPTKVRVAVGELPAEGTLGLIVQAITQNTHELLFFPSVASDVKFVLDNGDGTGTETVFDELGAPYTPVGAQTFTMQTVDPVSFFYNSHPPFKAGRIYPARRTGSIWLVFLPAKGNLEKSFEFDAGGKHYKLDVDGQGNVLDYTAV